MPTVVWVPLGVAIVGLAGTVIGIVAAKFTKFTARLEALERRHRLSGLYIRSLIDHAYRNNAVPLPDPPDGWLDALNGD
ncbi:hypothetical protein [Microbacterium sp. G2-8]|uniref:hypothetical protein n=1 Tax=Microbacterium sp. G2-8 TaxID=2842454 RepID=UPI0021AA7A7B|nr:hypothetical protein [Microbacterium sp. G2-8]